MIFSLKDEGCLLKCETFERHLVKDTTEGEALKILRDVSHHFVEQYRKTSQIETRKAIGFLFGNKETSVQSMLAYSPRANTLHEEYIPAGHLSPSLPKFKG